MEQIILQLLFPTIAGVSLAFNIIQHFEHKKQLDKAIDDGYMDGLQEGLSIGYREGAFIEVERERERVRDKHAEDCRKSRAKIKKEKEQKKKIIEDTTVVRVVEVPLIESTLHTNKQI